jgi:hypothetical protein
MISKELFENVLNDGFDGVYYFKDNIVWYEQDGKEYCINIYELSHLCKKWVVKNSGWTLQSYTNERDAGICRVKVGDGQEINKVIGVSEVDSIFKSTEWVYTELKNKGKIK